VKLLVTGGAGFIGSNFIRHVLAEHPDDTVVNLDIRTYTSNRAAFPRNLDDVEAKEGPRGRYRAVDGDIGDATLVHGLVRGMDAIVNFAAETHVDHSIASSHLAVTTNVVGVNTLLEAARQARVPRFLQIGTDEVYGSVATGSSRETDVLAPRNPYAASKAGADHLVLAHWHTHRLPVVITRSSNNFGPYQHPEKVIPLFITNALDGQPLPLYGDGRNVRDWLYVLDNCRGIDLVLRHGRDGEIYNIGGGHELENIALTREILRLTDRPASLITPVTDRPGHDRRYSLDSEKIRALGWVPRHDFAAALAATVAWYRDREAWWRPLKSDEFKAYYRRQYVNR
jgi:dTDP-glucose 4,6-dehydratase